MEPGDLVRVYRRGRVYEGIVMPRSELADDKHIVIKLSNGYNVGFRLKEVKVELIKKASRIEKSQAEVEESKKLPLVSLIGTGGTIASRVDYTTGAVHPAFSASEIAQAIPELKQIASLNTRVLFNILSENLTPEHWKKIAEAVAEELKQSQGVVVAHGTDTMSYTASALAFMLHPLPKPVVFVGSQRSSDRPSSDAALNLISAVRVALSDIAEVTVVMHSTSSDTTCTIHRATKVRKMHSSRRDAFKSINSLPIGIVKGEKIETFSEYTSRSSGEVKLDTRINPEVALVKIYPGFPEELFRYFAQKFKGLVIEGTGLGHAPEHLLPAIEEFAREKPVVMTTQTIFGRVDMKVYSTGRKLLKAGVIPGEDMLPEVALVKLMIALGRFSELSEIAEFMLTNIAGEITERSLYNTFF